MGKCYGELDHQLHRVEFEQVEGVSNIFIKYQTSQMN